MLNSKSGDTLVAKGDKFSLNQCPKEKLEIQEMKSSLYSSAIRRLMYAQVYTLPNVAYNVEVLGRYLSNAGMDH